MVEYEVEQLHTVFAGAIETFGNAVDSDDLLGPGAGSRLLERVLIVHTSAALDELLASRHTALLEAESPTSRQHSIPTEPLRSPASDHDQRPSPRNPHTRVTRHRVATG